MSYFIKDRKLRKITTVIIINYRHYKYASGSRVSQRENQTKMSTLAHAAGVVCRKNCVLQVRYSQIYLINTLFS